MSATNRRYRIAVIAGDGIGRQPLAIDETAEVGTGIFAGIQIGRFELVVRRQLALIQRQRGCWRLHDRLGSDRGRVFLTSGEGDGDGERQHQRARFECG